MVEVPYLVPVLVVALLLTFGGVFWNSRSRK